MHIGDNIKALRKSLNLTQKELGVKLGISQSAVGQLERKEAVNRSTVLRIAEKLQIDPVILDPPEDLTPELEAKLREAMGLPRAEVTEKGLIKNFNDLNTKGRERAFDYVAELRKIPDYWKETNTVGYSKDEFGIVMEETNSDFFNAYKKAPDDKKE